MNATPPTLPQPPRRAYPGLPVTQLRVGRVVMLVLIAGSILVGGALWLLTTQARPKPCHDFLYISGAFR